jgi:hypothetical protein
VYCVPRSAPELSPVEVVSSRRHRSTPRELATTEAWMKLVVLRALTTSPSFRRFRTLQKYYLE